MKEECLMAPLPVWTGIHVLPGLPDTEMELGGNVGQAVSQAKLLPLSVERPQKLWQVWSSQRMDIPLPN